MLMKIWGKLTFSHILHSFSLPLTTLAAVTPLSIQPAYSQQQINHKKIVFPDTIHYDESTKATYVFGELGDQQAETKRKEARRTLNTPIFQANSNVLEVYSKDPSIKTRLEELWYEVKQTIPNNYTIQVKQDILAEKAFLEQLPWVEQIVFETYIFLDDQITIVAWEDLIEGAQKKKQLTEKESAERATNMHRNDKNVRPNNWERRQQRHNSWLWEEYWSNVDIIQNSDSLYQLKNFKNDDNITFCLIDTWIWWTNNVLSQFNIEKLIDYNVRDEETNTPAQENSPGKHGNMSAAAMCAKINDNAWWAGMAWWGKLISLDCSTWATEGLGVNYIKYALQEILATAKQQKEKQFIINMSFHTPEDQSLFDLITELGACTTSSWAKQVFLFAAAGNAWNQYWLNTPANRPEVIPVGATYSNYPTKTIWEWSNLDQSGNLFFVLDWANSSYMYSLDGSFIYGHWTSHATPILAWIAWEVLAYRRWFGLPEITSKEEMMALLEKWAVQVQPPAWVTWNFKYVSVWSVVSAMIMDDLPDSFDAANNIDATISFTPIGTNTDDPSMMSNRKLFYPNGQECTTYTDVNGKRTYTLKITDENGFINGNNQIVYQFATPVSDQDLVEVRKSINLSNVPTPINEIEGVTTNVSVYPNPTYGIVNVSVPSMKKEDITVSLYTSTGIQMLSKTIPAVDSDNFQLDISSMASGAYILQLHGKTTNAIQKIMKM